MDLRILTAGVVTLAVLLGALSLLIFGGAWLALLAPFIAVAFVFKVYNTVPATARAYRLRYCDVDREKLAELVGRTWVGVTVGAEGMTVYLPTSVSAGKGERILGLVFPGAVVDVLSDTRPVKRWGSLPTTEDLTEAIEAGEDASLHLMPGPFGPVCWRGGGGWLPVGLGLSAASPAAYLPAPEASSLLRPRSPLLDVEQGPVPVRGDRIGTADGQEIRVPAPVLALGAPVGWLGQQIIQQPCGQDLYVLSPYRALLPLISRLGCAMYDASRETESVHLPLLTPEEATRMATSPWEGTLWLSWLFEALGPGKMVEEVADLVAALLVGYPEGRSLWVADLKRILDQQVVDMALRTDWSRFADQLGQSAVERLNGLTQSGEAQFTLSGAVSALRGQLDRLLDAPMGALWTKSSSVVDVDRLWIVARDDDYLGMRAVEWWLRKRVWFTHKGRSASLHVHTADRYWSSDDARAWAEWALSVDYLTLLLDVERGWDGAALPTLVQASASQVAFAPGSRAARSGGLFDLWGLALPEGEVASLPDGVGVAGWQNGHETYGVRVFEAALLELEEGR